MTQALADSSDERQRPLLRLRSAGVLTLAQRAHLRLAWGAAVANESLTWSSIIADRLPTAVSSENADSEMHNAVY